GHCHERRYPYTGQLAMKKNIFLILGCLSVFTTLAQQSELFMDGFAPSGAFQVRVDGGPLQIEYSPDFVSWMPLTNANDKVVDQGSAHSEWRLYRARKANGFTSNVVGFVRVPVPAGKMAAVASPFSAPIHLDQPRVRKAVLGNETPAVQ